MFRRNILGWLLSITGPNEQRIEIPVGAVFVENIGDLRMPTKRDKRLFGLAELLATELNKSKGDVQPEDIVSFMQCNVPISEEESSEEYDDMMKDRWERPAGRGTSAMARLRKSLGFVDGDSLISVIEKAAEACESYETLRAASMQAYGALIGSSAASDSVQGQAKARLKTVLGFDRK